MYCGKATVVAGVGDGRAGAGGCGCLRCALVISLDANSMKVGNGGQTVPGGNLADRLAALSASATDDDGVVTEEVDEPAMPVMPFPTFENVPTLPQQSPGNGYESGRDSRAR